MESTRCPIEFTSPLSLVLKLQLARAAMQELSPAFRHAAHEQTQTQTAVSQARPCPGLRQEPWRGLSCISQLQPVMTRELSWSMSLTLVLSASRLVSARLVLEEALAIG